MKLQRMVSMVLLCGLPLVSLAQWQWVDKDGRKVFSDRPPPAEIPDSAILKQPNRGTYPQVSVDAAPAASAVAKPSLAVPSKDADLEKKKKEADEQAAAKQKADAEKLKQQQAENCTRAQSGMATLNSGMRVRNTDAAGNISYLSDEGRAAEVARLKSIVSSDCK